MTLTPEHTRALAPDTSTLSRAEKLAHPRKWIVAERNERALWGECSSSAGAPYRTTVDLNGPAYKCSCPVKKFPCKHALALLLMAAEGDAQTFGQNAQPDWVTEWLDARDRRAAAKSVPKTEEQIAKSEANKEKSRLNRLDMMTEGVLDAQNRFLDIVRSGLLALDAQNGNALSFADFAARMVDAKLSGIGKKVKTWAQYKALYPDNWYEKVLSEMGTLYLLTKAFQKAEYLSEALQDELLNQLGVTVRKEDLFQQKGLVDDWLVLGQIETREEDNLTSRRVWLTGKASQRTVLVLDFAFGSVGFANAWLSGTAYRAEVVFYPSAYPLRVAPKTVEMTSIFSQIVGFQDFAQLLEAYSAALMKNPWLGSFPALVAQVRPVVEGDRFFLVDSAQKILPTEGGLDLAWQLVAISGGAPIHVFGEWSGEHFLPLSTFADGRYLSLTNLP